MKQFKKFLREVDEHEKTDFLLKWFFWIRSFFDPLHLKKLTKKWPEAKKLKYKKINLFMSINHAKAFLKSFHTVGFFSWPFSETLNFYFKMGGRFFKKILGSNHYYWLVLWLVKWAPESKNLASPLIPMAMYFTSFYI